MKNTDLHSAGENAEHNVNAKLQHRQVCTSTLLQRTMNLNIGGCLNQQLLVEKFIHPQNVKNGSYN